MRKKSHISLARYMVEHLNDEGLSKHKLSFYIGSILPDIKPSFIYKRHEINGTFPSVSKHIARLVEGEKAMTKRGLKYYMDLGQISHYLADYFTFPHNHIYTGNLKAHCSYEEKLKHDLRAFINNREEKHILAEPLEFNSVTALCDYIQCAHEEYLVRKHDVEDDIRHIIYVNHLALYAMLSLLARRKMEYCKVS